MHGKPDMLTLLHPSNHVINTSRYIDQAHGGVVTALVYRGSSCLVYWEPIRTTHSPVCVPAPTSWELLEERRGVGWLAFVSMALSAPTDLHPSIRVPFLLWGEQMTCQVICTIQPGRNLGGVVGCRNASRRERVRVPCVACAQYTTVFALGNAATFPPLSLPSTSIQ